MAVVSRDRQLQGAAQKLTQLGAQVSYGADRQVQGTLTFSRVVAPVTANNIRKGSFVLVDNEHIRFTEPPLDVLGQLSFMDAEDGAAFEKKVQQGLERRMMLLISVDSRMKNMRVLTAIDPARLVSVGMIQAGEVKLDIEVEPDGVRVIRVLPPRGNALEVPRSFPPVVINDLQTQSELEMYFTALVPRLVQAAAQAHTGKRRDDEDATDAFHAGGAHLEPVAPPANTPTLRTLLQKFGDHAVPSKIELVAAYQVGKKRFRLVAYHEAGSIFKARLLDAADPDTRGLWSGDIDLAKVGSVDDLVASVIGVATLPQPGQAPPTHRPPSQGRTPAGQPAGRDFEEMPTTAPNPAMAPRPGEVWVMNVVVEKDDGKTIRYMCIDADGRPYGAPQSLARPDFFQVFSAAPNGSFRLCVIVDAVRSDHVIYRQMDAARVPGGEPVRIPLSHLAAAFVPEATLY